MRILTVKWRLDEWPEGKYRGRGARYETTDDLTPFLEQIKKDMIYCVEHADVDASA